MASELEVEVENVSVVENASNLTGRDAATMEGIVLTYSSLFFMALAPILFGSLRSVSHHHDLKSKGEEATDKIDMRDAAMFPLYASGGLFGLYLFFKYVPKDYVNMLLNVLFFGLGVSALARATSALLDPLLPKFITSRLTHYHLQLTTTPAKGPQEQSEWKFHTLDIGVMLVCGLTGIAYFLSRNWILNNLVGLAFSMNAIELISLDSVAVGCLLLGGLFIYDIFWVFGTDVMVTVAKSFEAPIKLMFPMDLLEKGLSANNFGMLGLGDIVVPGLYIALLCRFDFSHRPGKSQVYFYTGFIAYIIGLGTTIAVMHVFHAAQPALLYLVPSCLGLPFLVALLKGDLAELLRYKDYPETPRQPHGQQEPGSGDATEKKSQ